MNYQSVHWQNPMKNNTHQATCTGAAVNIDSLAFIWIYETRLSLCLL